MYRPFVGISKYEFSYNNNYGSSINSLKYKINSIKDINTINYDEIINNEFHQPIIDEINKRRWHNDTELVYLKELDNIENNGPELIFVDDKKKLNKKRYCDSKKESSCIIY